MCILLCFLCINWIKGVNFLFKKIQQTNSNLYQYYGLKFMVFCADLYFYEQIFDSTLFVVAHNRNNIITKERQMNIKRNLNKML